MKMIAPLIIFFSSFQVWADKIESKIHSIVDSDKKGIPHIIKLENGRVVFVQDNDESTVHSFKHSFEKNDLLEIKVDDKNDFISVQTKKTYGHFELDAGESKVHASYEPTVVQNVSEASAIFRRMRKDFKYNGQCYNRAHIWTWEEYYYNKINSVKLFMFFTNRYIRNYHFRWWFHVSPMVKSMVGDLVLDRSYMIGPRDISTWTKKFIKSGRSCPKVNNYFDYSNHEEEEDCYLLPVPMYFWQPKDIRRRDTTGQEKIQYHRSEVEYAYWEAFK